MTRAPIPSRPGMYGMLCMLLLASVVLSSCGPGNQIFDDRIEQDLGFGFEDLRKGSVLVAGMAAAPGHLGAEERVKLGVALSNMLLAGLHGAPGIHLVGPGTVVQRIGLDAYDDLMRGVDAEGGLSVQDLPVLDSVAPDIRHVLIAYVTNENVMDFADEHYSDDGGERTTDYEKRHYLTIDFQLYDTRYQKMVLSHVIHNEATRTESRTTSTGCVEGCLQSVIQSILFGDPAEISREEVLSDMVERFTARLRTTHARTRQP